MTIMEWASYRSFWNLSSESVVNHSDVWDTDQTKMPIMEPQRRHM